MARRDLEEALDPCNGDFTGDPAPVTKLCLIVVPDLIVMLLLFFRQRARDCYVVARRQPRRLLSNERVRGNAFVQVLDVAVPGNAFPLHAWDGYLVHEHPFVLCERTRANDGWVQEPILTV